MTVQEMHIDIDIEAQKVGSAYFRKFTPEEIDWLLNREVERFVKDRIKKDQDSLGFEATEVDMDAIRPLIINDQVLTVRKNSLTDRTVFAWLPANYSYLVDDYSIVLRACNKTEYLKGMNYASSDEYLYVIPVNQSGNTPAYGSYSLIVNDALLLNVSSGPELQTPDEVFTFADYLLNQLWSMDGGNMTYYWEQYGTYYKRGSLIIVSPTQLTGLTAIEIDGTEAVATEVHKTFLATPLITPTTKEKEPVPNRLIKGSARSNVLNSTFAKTSYSSPVSSVDGQLLRVYHDTTFIVNSIMISYIRKPRKISLALNTDCDLPEEFHSQIVDRVVSTMKRLTQNPDYQAAFQDLELNKN